MGRRDKYEPTKKLYWVEVTSDAKFETIKEEEVTHQFEGDDIPGSVADAQAPDVPEPGSQSDEDSDSGPSETPEPKKKNKRKKNKRGKATPSSTEPKPKNPRESTRPSSRKSAEIEMALQELLGSGGACCAA